MSKPEIKAVEEDKPDEKSGTISLTKHLESEGGTTLKAKVGGEERELDVRRACVICCLDGSEILRQRQNARGEPSALSMAEIIRIGVMYGKMENDENTGMTIGNKDKDLILKLGHVALSAVVLTALVRVLDPGQLEK